MDEESGPNADSVIAEEKTVGENIAAKTRVHEVIDEFLSSVEEANAEKVIDVPEEAEQFDPAKELATMEEELPKDKGQVDLEFEEIFNQVDAAVTETIQLEKKRKLKATPPSRWSSRQKDIESSLEVDSEPERLQTVEPT